MPGTALDRYALLEAVGTYFDGRSARAAEVVVKFGKASLTLSDLTDRPLTHWALASLRALPDAGGADVLVLVPQGSAEERLTVSDPDMIQALRLVCPDLERRETVPGQARRAVIWGLGALGAVVLILFVLVPAIAERLAVLIPPAREQALGAAVLDQIRYALGQMGDRDVRVCDAPEGVAALTRMRDRLAPHLATHVPVTVGVLDHEMVNAFALPGGHIMLFRGLIEEADGPEQVAGVLAHEMGHVAHRDPTRLALRSAGSVGILGLILGDFTGGAAVLILTEQLIAANYTREAEAAADVAAHGAMAGAGLPLEPFALFFERLAAEAGRTPRILSHLASHPDLGARAAAARDADVMAGAAFDPVLTDQDWVALRGICDR